ncbi:hypothetical protein ACS0TY_011302 [Phlomoides rotata]
MERTQSSQSSCGDNVPIEIDSVCRRVWTLNEENMLARAMETIIQRGWKLENGFRSGYLKLLEKEMKLIDPTCDLRAEPHISLRIHAWKRNHAVLTSVINKSGMSWDSIKYQIVVENEDVWADYIKVDPYAKGMRYKSYPLYGKWTEIFGCENAKGDQSEDCDITRNNELPEGVEENISQSTPDPNVASKDSPGTQSDATSPSSKGKGKKRKTVDSTEIQMVNLMGRFLDTTGKHLSNMISKIGYEKEMSEKRSKVIEELGKLGCLTPDQRIIAAKMLANNNDLELFFSANLEDRSRLVYLMLSGHL